MKSQALWSVWNNFIREIKIRLDFAARVIDFLTMNAYILGIEMDGSCRRSGVFQVKNANISKENE
jgi:hypothetical protein